MKFFLYGSIFVWSLMLKPTLANEVFFSPKGGCEARLVQYLSAAKHSIQAIVYSINNRNIMNALKRAQARGVKVQLLTDRLQAYHPSSGALELRMFPIDIKIHSYLRIEHNKFAVIDNRYVETGSFNWTEPGEKLNSENCIFFRKRTVAKKFATRFRSLWSKNSRKASEEHFRRLAKRRPLPIK